MKRKIKFRAWHIEEKLMCKVDTLTDKGAFLIGVKKGEDTHEGKWFIYSPKDGRFCLNDEFELMQFTGLKDKSEINNCIYEEDIVSLQGNVIGNKYENSELLKNETNLLIEGFGTKTWRITEEKAMARGCYYSE
jgi:hypothetical protein